MQSILDTRTHRGATINIGFDDDPTDPREWPNHGVMFCRHRDSDLGDVQVTLDDGEDAEDALARLVAEHSPTVILPLFLLDHSSLSMRTGTFGSDPGGWDTSFVGWIMDTAATREDMKFDGDATDMAGFLADEVGDYSRYLSGMVYRYDVLDRDGEVYETCGGFYDDADALAEAISDADCLADRQAAEDRDDLLAAA